MHLWYLTYKSKQNLIYPQITPRKPAFDFTVPLKAVPINHIQCSQGSTLRSYIRQGADDQCCCLCVTICFPLGGVERKDCAVKIEGKCIKLHNVATIISVALRVGRGKINHKKYAQVTLLTPVTMKLACPVSRWADHRVCVCVHVSL